MMIQAITETEFQATQGAKTFNAKQFAGGDHWTVTSWNTNQPTARYFWGCRTFRTLAEIDGHYKAFRGITALVELA